MRPGFPTPELPSDLPKKHRHHHPGDTTISVVTVNDDFGTRKSNLPHLHAGVILGQETKVVNSQHALGKDYGVHQNTDRLDKKGTTVAWKKDRFHALHSGYAMGVEPHGRGMLNRWINFTDMEVEGKKVRMVSVHRPPERFKSLWPLFDKNLADFVKQSKLPVIIGMDANQHDPKALAKMTGLEWHAPEGSIDGFLTTPGIKVSHMRRLNKGSSDHHPVQAQFTIPEGLG